jgi:hypothetical protein
MKRLLVTLTFALILVAGIDPRVDACSYCDPAFKRRLTLREDVRFAKFVVLGTATDSKINADMTSETAIAVESVVKDDPFLKDQKRLSLPRYIPVDAKNPPTFILFGDLFNGKADLYRGVPVKDRAVVEYLREVVKLDDKQRQKSLLYYFHHLDSPYPEIAADAFLEFAKANDLEVANVAKAVQPDRLRKLLLDPKTPPERLSLFAFLLGSCGEAKDEGFLKQLLAKNDDRTQASLGGILGGLIELKPKEGWNATTKIVADAKESFANRLSALNTVRFYQGCKAMEHREAILAALRPVILDGELADMAIEDLRRWGWRDWTKLILEQAPKPSHAAPIVQRAIVRYAVCCPDPACVDFVQAYRRAHPSVVQEVEEGLEFEKPTAEKK